MGVSAASWIFLFWINLRQIAEGVYGMSARCSSRRSHLRGCSCGRAGRRERAGKSRRPSPMLWCSRAGRRNCPRCGSSAGRDDDSGDIRGCRFELKFQTSSRRRRTALTDPKTTCSSISPVLALATRTVVAQPLPQGRERNSPICSSTPASPVTRGLHSLTHAEHVPERTFVVQDVLCEGQHGREHGADAQPQHARADEEKHAAGVEDDQQEVHQYGPHLRQTCRRTEGVIYRRIFGGQLLVGFKANIWALLAQTRTAYPNGLLKGITVRQ